MDITCFNMSASKNKVDKTEDIKELVKLTDTHLKDDVSVIKPSIILKKFDKWNKCNYIYIPLLNRYYYVSDKILLKGGLLQFDLFVDVLMSNKDDIKKIQTLILRQENEHSSLIADTELKITSKREVIAKQIGKIPTGLSYLLTVSGGGS